MSSRSSDRSRATRKLCQTCRDRKARFRFRGEVRADRDHTLCFECFRAQRERNRAAALADAGRTLLTDAAPVAPLGTLFGSLAQARTLNAAEIEHRRRMLTHLHGLSTCTG